MARGESLLSSFRLEGIRPAGTERHWQGCGAGAEGGGQDERWGRWVQG